MKNISKGKIFFCGSFFCFCIAVVFFYYSIVKKSSYISECNLIIERLSDDGLSYFLVDKKISDNFLVAKVLIKVMRLFNHTAKFGEYTFPNNVSLFEAVKIIDSGRVVIHKITIPEGLSVVQVIRLLEKNYSLLGKVEQVPAEGSIMPDTYCFKYPTKKQDIISIAQKKMYKFIKNEWPKRSNKCTLKTPYDALILASIVEKETSLEREIIAGVYLQRLKIGMKLQSCPTVIYAHKKGDKLCHNLKYSELKIQNPYNTYIYGGLPPTPITNPGKACILAVLNPEETENLFFVFDGVSKHMFSKTYDEHKKNIAKIRQLKISEAR